MFEYLYYLLLGIAPAIFYLCYIYKKDKWEPEPKLQVVKIFFLGILAIPLAGVAEYFLMKMWNLDVFQAGPKAPSAILSAIACFLVIAPIEEFFKYSAVKVFIYPKKDFNEPIDGVVYMVAAAMGFAGIENFMYIINDSHPTTVGILRGVLSTPAHAIFSGFIGIYLGRAKFCDNSLKAAGLIIWGFLIAIGLHGAYNFFLLSGSILNFPIRLEFLAIGMMIVAAIVLVAMINKAAHASPFRKEDNQLS